MSKNRSNQRYRVTFSAQAKHRQEILKVINELTDRWNETRTDVILKALGEFVDIHKDESQYKRLIISDKLERLAQRWELTISDLVIEAIRDYLYLHQDEEIPSSVQWVIKTRELSEKLDLTKGAVISQALKEFEEKSEED